MSLFHTRQFREGTRGERPTRMRRVGRWIRRTVLLTCLLGAVGLGVAIWLMRSTPSYWQEHLAKLEATPEAVQHARAHEVQQQIADILEKAIADAALQRAQGHARKGRMGDAHDYADAVVRDATLFLTYDQLNSWLSVNFADWMHEQGFEKPEQITRPMVAYVNQQPRIAFMYESSYVSQLFSANAAIRFDHERNRAQLQVRNLTAGQLPLPVQQVGSHIQRIDRHSVNAREVGQWLSRLQQVEFRPRFRDPQRGDANVIGMSHGQHGVTLQLRLRPSPRAIALASHQHIREQHIATAD